MKSRTIFFITIAASAAAFTLFAQNPGATSDADAKAVAAIVAEIQGQQKTIAENQAKVDEKLAAIGEEIRLARLYVARGGSRK